MSNQGVYGYDALLSLYVESKKRTFNKFYGANFLVHPNFPPYPPLPLFPQCYPGEGEGEYI